MFKNPTDIQPGKLFSDDPQGSASFNIIKTDVQADLERIDQVFALVNALCDVFMDEPKKEINKWANSKLDEHTKKINNSFLL
ncbi:MAG: hypothetical protein H0U95_03385 [Bacteroidetes bacterium]|nr:hypothetical protein [Bacteroidota bacterium]